MPTLPNRKQIDSSIRVSIILSSLAPAILYTVLCRSTYQEFIEKFRLPLLYSLLVWTVLCLGHILDLTLRIRKLATDEGRLVPKAETRRSLVVIAWSILLLVGQVAVYFLLKDET